LGFGYPGPTLVVMAMCLLLLPTISARAADGEPRVATEAPAVGKENRAFISVEGNASILSDLAEKSIFSGMVSYGLRAGYRWSRLGVFAHIEHNMWHAMEFDSSLEMGAFNIGIGCEYVYAGGLIRSSLAIGPSVLLEDTPLDRAGSVGLFLDARPAGFRFQAHDNLVIGIDPISFSIVAPSLKNIPLFRVVYRTSLYAEVVF